MGIVRFNDALGPNEAGNPLPNHPDQGVNTITEDRSINVISEVGNRETNLLGIHPYAPESVLNN